MEENKINSINAEKVSRQTAIKDSKYFKNKKLVPYSEDWFIFKLLRYKHKDFPNTKNYIIEELKKNPDFKLGKGFMVKQDFISESLKTHNYKYSFDKVPDIIESSGTKVIVTCLEISKKTGNIYGDFETDYLHFVTGKQNHPKLSNDLHNEYLRNKGKEKFLEKIKNKFPNITVDESSYVDMKTPVKCICDKHGEFTVIPCNMLLSNYGGCPSCYIEKIDLQEIIRRTEESFIKNFGIECDYDFSKSIYKGLEEPIEVICPRHGSFWIKPLRLIYRKSMCPECLKEIHRKKRESEFIEKSKKIFGNNRFDYSLVHYETRTKKVTLICPKHGEFQVIPRNHLIGEGCPKCSASCGEIVMMNTLDSLDISYNYIYEVKDDDFIAKNDFSKLVIDFHIKLNNGSDCFIEINGEQHYKQVDIFGGKERFERQLKRDKLLKDFCKNNNIYLIEIPFLYHTESMTFNKILEINKRIKELLVDNEIFNSNGYIRLFDKELKEFIKNSHSKNGGSEDE